MRAADKRDLPALQAIEMAADRMFDHMVDLSQWGTPTGEERAATDGFILVAGDPPVGFAHVIRLDGEYHFEQLAVHPDHGRQGIGTELVYSVVDLVASLGGRSLTLMTFADVPWNAPFYQSLGFEIIDPPPRLAPLLNHEHRIGLDRAGSRVAMLREITPGVEPRAAVSVIPVRDGERGLEVFIQHRVHTMDFAPGVVVFPGGRIDPVDAEDPPSLRDDVLDELVDVWGESTYVSSADDPRSAIPILIAAAVREVEEETGVRLDVEELVPWDDWTTPPGFPKRFQVHFMVAHLPASDPRSPVNTTTEALQSEWLPVGEILERGQGGDLQIMTPTRVILQELADLGSAAAVMNAHPRPVPVHLDRTGRRPRPSRHA